MIKTIKFWIAKLGFDKEVNSRVLETRKKFKKRVENVPYFFDLSDFLQLLDLAEYGFMGKSDSIICAFRIGYLAGQKAENDCKGDE